MSDVPEPLPDDPDELMGEVRRRVEGRLGPAVAEDAPAPDPSAPPPLLGAGSDNVEEGRSYLTALEGTGLAVPTWPREYGGLGLDADRAGLVARGMAGYRHPDLYPFGVGLALVGPVLLAHGTEDQRRRWLPGIRTGEEIWCQLFSEPDAGSDLAGLTSRAGRDGDVWRVSGQKVWSSRAAYSAWGLLLARTDADVSKHDGITAFGIRMDQPGVEVRPLRQMNGDSHFSEVFFDGAVIDDADRIDEPGRGWTVALTTLAHERAGLGGGGLGGTGLGGGAGGRLVELARRRSVASDPVRRQQVIDAWMHMEVARLTATRTHDNAKAGKAGRESAGMKIRFTDALKRVAETALSMEGPAGVAGMSSWETTFLTAPSLSIRGGTDEVQRNVVGDRVLGLPREPRDDKGVPFRELRPH